MVSLEVAEAVRILLYTIQHGIVAIECKQDRSWKQEKVQAELVVGERRVEVEAKDVRASVDEESRCIDPVEDLQPRLQFTVECVQ